MNAIPVFIASDPEWAAKFEAAGLPIVGDDIKSQVGATIVHRILARLFEDRGMVLDRTYQLNVGGNMDFMNMLERERLESKKISKTQSVTSQIDHGIEADDVHIGPSDHVAWLQDRKWAYIRLEGRNFGDVPLNVELKLEVWDSPNSAGVIIDALRCAKVAKDRGLGGPLLGPSAYFMKSPPVQYRDEEARAHGRGLRRRPASGTERTGRPRPAASRSRPKRQRCDDDLDAVLPHLGGRARTSPSSASPWTRTTSARLPGSSVPSSSSSAHELGRRLRRGDEGVGRRSSRSRPSGRARAGSGRAAPRRCRSPSRSARRPRWPP